MKSSSESWPPAAGLSTVVVPRSEAILTTIATTSISAPASLVFDIVRNAGDYGSWNTFVPRVTIHSQPAGVDSSSAMLENQTSFTYHVIMDSSKPTKETPTQLRVTDVSTPEKPSSYIPQDVLDSDETYTSDLSDVYRISWSSEGGLVSRGLKTERFHEIIVVDENSCHVRTWENHGNFLARTVKWMYQDTLRVKFQDWCDDLKKYSEQKVKG
jgi:hypothetical protein